MRIAVGGKETRVGAKAKMTTSCVAFLSIVISFLACSEVAEVHQGGCCFVKARTQPHLSLISMFTAGIPAFRHPTSSFDDCCF